MTSKNKPLDPIRYHVLGARLIAFVIDQVIVWTPIFLLEFYYFPEDNYLSVTDGVVLIILFLVWFMFYHVFLEFKWGQTIGKKILNIKVFQENGSQLTLISSVIRNLFKFGIYLFHLGILITLFLMNTTEKKQRFGDILAKTVVVDLVKYK